MAWVAVDKDGAECICYDEPQRWGDVNGEPAKYFWDVKRIPFKNLSYWVDFWEPFMSDEYCVSRKIYLPKGSIKKLIGRELTWDDDPVEI